MKQQEIIGQSSKEVEQSLADQNTFRELVELEAYFNFSNTDLALKEVQLLNESAMSEVLVAFLESKLPSKRKKITLGVQDINLGRQIAKQLEVQVLASEQIQELMRGVRTHQDAFFSDVSKETLDLAQLGLGHSFSRQKIMFDPNRQDKPVIQVVALLDSLDKDINLFSMRLKEWQSWHFPELIRIVNDNYLVTAIVSLFKTRNNLLEMLETDEQSTKDQLTLIIGDDEKTNQLLEAAKTSMGVDISELDSINIANFTRRIKRLISLRQKMFDQLGTRMKALAPNLTSILGELVAAKLLSHAGSLTNLAKYPASTIQILGAEKALFRALKTRGKTPKYGLLYNSSFIGKAKKEDKGKVSRILANKISLAVKVDNFAENDSSAFGEVLRKQLEEKVAFQSGRVRETKTNDEWVAEAVESWKNSVKESNPLKRKGSDMNDEEGKKKKKKDSEKKEKKDKKDKKKRREEQEMEESVEKMENLDIESEKEKKKKKKKNKD